MSLIKKLEGKKTYIVAVVLAVVNLLTVFGVEINPEQIKAINMLLGALGLLFLRAGVQKTDDKISSDIFEQQPYGGMSTSSTGEISDEAPPTQEEKDFFK